MKPSAVAAMIAALALSASRVAAGGPEGQPDLEGCLVTDGTAGPCAASAEAQAAGDRTARAGIEATAANVAAVEPPLSVDIGAFRIVPSLEYRLRYRHYEGHDFTEGGVTDTLRHRARVGLEASWAGRVGVKVEVQDVRTFGEETSPSADYAADGFDVHQAYASVLPVPELELRIGRQEIAFENERLIGRGNFSEPGRSFDAVRLVCSALRMKLDAFYSKVRESNLALDLPPEDSAERHLLGADLHYDLRPELGMGFVGTVDVSELNGKQQHTVGAVVSAALRRSLTNMPPSEHRTSSTAACRGAPSSLADSRTR